jgi:mycothiol synthase
MTLAAERVGAYAIEQAELATLPDERLRRVAELVLVMDREAVPEDPETPIEVVMQRWRAKPELMIRTDWIATATSGQVVGRSTLIRYEAPENRHLRETVLHVHPDHRRRGLGRALFAQLVNAACAERDDILLTGGTTSRVPAGEAFANRIGAEAALNNRLSQLDLEQLDRAMVRSWAALDPGGYRLVWIDREIPDALMANVIVAYDAMNTAPRGGLRVDDWKMTPEIVRDWERAERLKGMEHRLLLAIDDATGETAGFTEVAYDPRVAHVVYQHGTAVVPAHRGHGIGKWLKARMLARVDADWPHARFVRTGNAYSNAPMLSINDRLGFKVAWSKIHWQIGIGAAMRYVEGRSTGR